MRVAVIGTGIAGLGAAWALHRAHEVEVFEEQGRAGGHANTILVSRPGGGELPLDTGFIVYNEHNYPRLSRLFRELGVATQDSDMSFAVSCERCRLQYAGVRLWSQPQAFARPGFGRLVGEIVRFLRTGERALEPRYHGASLGRFMADEGYSASFVRHYLVPFTAALWSMGSTEALSVPARYAVGFFRNHGLIGFRRFQWRTVVGGSQEYVRRVVAPLGERLHLSAPVRAVRRDADGVEVRTADDRPHRFDAVVIATHAPQALGLLVDPDDREREVLGAFRTTASTAVLHTDERLLAARPGARGSWNYHVDDCRLPTQKPTVTYYLNRLQRLDEPRHYAVTLNREERIAPGEIIRRIEYAHPLYTFEALDAQERIPGLSNRRRTWFCGAYQGYGFHECGLASGLRAAGELGAPW